MVWRVLILVFLISFLAPAEDTDPPPALTCPAGAPLGVVEPRVKSPSSSETLPFQEINHLSEGDTILYSPVLRGTAKRPGKSRSS
jgi:hypothetical protein